MTQSEIQYYVQKRREGWDNSQVRKDIKRVSRLENEDISFYISQIDDLYIETLAKPINGLVSKKLQYTIKLLGGVLLIILSIIPVLFSIQGENVAMVKIVGAMLLSGMALIINAKRQKRKLLNEISLLKLNEIISQGVF